MCNRFLSLLLPSRVGGTRAVSSECKNEILKWRDDGLRTNTWSVMVGV